MSVMSALSLLSSLDFRLFIVFAATQLFFYAYARSYVSSRHQIVNSATTSSETRARAWLLSLLVAAVLSLVGVVKAIEVGAAVMLGGIPGFVAFIYGGGFFEKAVTIFFMAFLVLDIGVGYFDYLETFRWDTTWLHHFAYMIISVYVIRLGAVNCFLVFSLCEVPTLILALGHIEPSLRNDYAFGVVFALTRLLYFGLVSIFLWLATTVRFI